MATTDKYDRQLRLWGANGQKALMTSHILLIHANGVGSETLKNLVLPGIGNFTILDDYSVTPNDLSSNFFVTEESLGKPRAEVVRDLLCEMNSDVTGNARVANFQNVLQTEPSFFEKFNLIIAANLPETQASPLARLCQEKAINLVLLRSYGFIGSLRLQLPRHSIVEAKKDQQTFDLRINDAFPELAEYCRTFPDFASLDSMEHAHIPFIVILFQALQRWKEQNQGAPPTSSADKTAFQRLIESMSRNIHNEVNFQEARREYFSALKRATPSVELQTLLEQQHDQVLTPNDDVFSFLLRSLELFLQENGQLVPLSGLLPDMTATTERYVQLQTLFHDKAARDRQRFQTILHQQLQEVGIAEPDLIVSEEEIETFCKNCQTLGLVQTTAFADEIALPSGSPQTRETVREVLTSDLFEDPVQTPLLWYLSLRAVDSFHSKYARWPGSNSELLVHDQLEVFRELQRVAESLQIPSELVGPPPQMMIPDTSHTSTSMMETDHTTPSNGLLTMAHAVEITRCGGLELHTISSVMGGIAAQEVVKVITHQYEPLNNTYVFNGIATCGAVYTL